MAELYRIELYSKAQKEIDDLPKDYFKKIDRHIRELAGSPRPYGSIKLEKTLYRFRVDPFRIIYSVDDFQRKVVILHVRRRNEKTYRNLE